jgi:UDP-glucose 4-epimerase
MEQSNLGQRRKPAVFITGAGGEVGHGLISALSNEDCLDIVATDLRDVEQDLKDQCSETYIADVCDRDALDRLLAMFQVKEIYHLAAMLSTRAELAPEVAHQVNMNIASHRRCTVATSSTANILVAITRIRIGNLQKIVLQAKIKTEVLSTFAAFATPDLFQLRQYQLAAQVISFLKCYTLQLAEKLTNVLSVKTLVFHL